MGSGELGEGALDLRDCAEGSVASCAATAAEGKSFIAQAGGNIVQILLRKGDNAVDVANNNAIESILNADRVGSGLKDDVYHKAASYLSKEQLQKGRSFPLKGNDGVTRTLFQVKGKVNGELGVFEYIIDTDGTITHQLFKKGKKVNGVPN